MNGVLQVALVVTIIVSLAAAVGSLAWLFFTERNERRSGLVCLAFGIISLITVNVNAILFAG